MSNVFFGLSYDADDAGKAAAFWAAALGRKVAAGADRDTAVVEPADVATSGHRLAFHRVPEGKTVKNRMHLDLRVGAERREAEVARLVAAGATELHRASQGPHEWATLADPEGNEFCVA
jgi:hypothetical protein